MTRHRRDIRAEFMPMFVVTLCLNVLLGTGLAIADFVAFPCGGSTTYCLEN